MTRAKFKVQSIVRTMGSKRVDGQYVPAEVHTIVLYPVTGTDGENAQFWAATPSGKVELGCVNAEAVKCFDLEREFYVDFTPADGE